MTTNPDKTRAMLENICAKLTPEEQAAFGESIFTGVYQMCEHDLDSALEGVAAMCDLVSDPVGMCLAEFVHIVCEPGSRDPVDFRFVFEVDDDSTLVLTRRLAELTVDTAHGRGSRCFASVSVPVRGSPVEDICGRIWDRITGDNPRDRDSDGEVYVILD